MLHVSGSAVLLQFAAGADEVFFLIHQAEVLPDQDAPIITKDHEIRIIHLAIDCQFCLIPECDAAFREKVCQAPFRFRTYHDATFGFIDFLFRFIRILLVISVEPLPLHW